MSSLLLLACLQLLTSLLLQTPLLLLASVVPAPAFDPAVANVLAAVGISLVHAVA
jgi:hypothetical protein